MLGSSAVNWIRSSRCDTGACLEVALIDDQVTIRNSSQLGGPQLTVSRQRWALFLTDLKAQLAQAT